MQKEGLVSGTWLYVRTRHPFHWWGQPCMRAQGLARKAWAKLIPCACHLTSSRISAWCGSVTKLQHIRVFADCLLPPWWCPCLPGTALPLAPTISSYLSFKTCFKHHCLLGGFSALSAWINCHYLGQPRHPVYTSVMSCCQAVVMINVYIRLLPYFVNNLGAEGNALFIFIILAWLV